MQTVESIGTIGPHLGSHPLSFRVYANAPPTISVVPNEVRFGPLPQNATEYRDVNLFQSPLVQHEFAVVEMKPLADLPVQLSLLDSSLGENALNHTLRLTLESHRLTPGSTTSGSIDVVLALGRLTRHISVPVIITVQPLARLVPNAFLFATDRSTGVTQASIRIIPTDDSTPLNIEPLTTPNGVDVTVQATRGGPEITLTANLAQVTASHVEVMVSQGGNSQMVAIHIVGYGR